MKSRERLVWGAIKMDRAARHEFWASEYRREMRRKRRMALGLFLFLVSIIGLLGILLK